MTKSLRWGVGSLMALAGLVAVTSFVGLQRRRAGPRTGPHGHGHAGHRHHGHLLRRAD